MDYPKSDPVMLEHECGYWLCGSDGITNAAWKASSLFMHLRSSDQSPLTRNWGRKRCENSEE